ncbi:MAG: glutaminyl-peptide cyclotransferase [Bdellovibrionales bacterium]|nr:glutaminyl-peptide cyclotransferase [Bdellovibrionales bacterium]
MQSCDDNSSIPKENKIVVTKVKTTPLINYVYVNSYPHDTNSFTEGFLMYNGDLYESTGATPQLPQTRSLFGVVNKSTGIIDVKVELDKTKYFGEGITFLDDKVFQLTYRAKVGFIYDAVSFKELGRFELPSNEGWGLTTDEEHLIMSDGTDALYFLDPKNLSVVKIIKVSENGYPKHRLNELEYINGFIYANIWMTNTIVKIDITTGDVVGKLDLTPIAEEAKYLYHNIQEMNGIAFDSVTGNVLITGKMWPKYFEIKFNH